ncbi:hypothetical protein BBB56_21890 [Candidatus Pantoea deserta]|uniref:Uncharacterized protein n=1 Tax=Candidatus Pantoea deserta TaxID=1869313 RepID=A0A3N4NGZ1_9GAMM|nr:hypothetical protein BBB56_21890 [Pantoea deserta]
MDCRGSFRRGYSCLHLRINLLVVIKPVKKFVLNTLLVIFILLLIDYFTVENFLTVKNSIKIILTGIITGIINYKLCVK